jgi:hemolysin D
VKEGQSVQAGELLIKLDPTVKQADLARVFEGYVSAKIEAERYQALLDAILGTGRDVIKTSLLVSSTLLQSQQAALDGELAEFRARNQSFEAEISKRKVELQSVREVVSKLQSLLPLAKSRADDVKRLRNEG